MTLVAAVAENLVIGRDGGLPWHLPADLKHFQKVTMGHVVLMGRRTWESLGGPLEGRENWVLTGDRSYRASGARVFHALDDARKACAGELQILGGAKLFTAALPHASGMELTRVHARPEGDTYFPAFDMAEWEEVWRAEHPADARNAYACSFVRLIRRTAVHSA